MRIAKEIAAIVFWFSLCTGIPATLLYPIALWMLSHTTLSQFVVVKLYVVGIGLFFLPTALLIDLIYRRIRPRAVAAEPGQNSSR